MNVRTLVGVAGRDWGCKCIPGMRARSEERGLGEGGMGGRLVGDGERLGGWVYCVCSCS